MDLLSLPFGIEHLYKGASMARWGHHYWMQSLYITAVYVVLVHWGQRIMKTRKKFILRKPLFLWNLGLAAFSTIGFCRVFATIVGDLLRYGWQHSLCSLEWLNGPPGVWGFLFIFSKVVELFDTMFVVLRKQKLVFLHWYHHVTVCCLSWFTLIHLHGPARIFMAINFFVHSLMYSYYAVRAQGLVRIPRAVSIGITSLQIAQMLFAVFGYVLVYLMQRSGVSCNSDHTIVVIALAMYLSYTVLFCHLFYTNYVKGGN